MPKVNPIPPSLSEKDILRFWSHVNKTLGQGPNGNCWEWQKKRDLGGYGHFTISLGYRTWRHMKASRVAFLLTNGYWPTQLVLHHCDNPPCCNPEHLFEGDHYRNYHDAEEKGRLPRGDNHWMRTRPETIPRGSVRGSAKLTELKVQEIRKQWATGTLQKTLAVNYGVCKQLICLIVNNKIWKHV